MAMARADWRAHVAYVPSGENRGAGASVGAEAAPLVRRRSLHRRGLLTRRERVRDGSDCARGRRIVYPSRPLATWRSGYAAACKAVYTGSIPVVALSGKREATRAPSPETYRYASGSPRAISSAGRAPPRQGGGHWFEPSIAHRNGTLAPAGVPSLSSRPCAAHGSPASRSTRASSTTRRSSSERRSRSRRPAEEAWAELTAENPLAWCSVIDAVRWTSPRPFGVGTTWTVTSLHGANVLDERFFRWEEGRRKSFYAVRSSGPLFRRFAEDYVVEPVSESIVAADVDGRLRAAAAGAPRDADQPPHPPARCSATRASTTPPRVSSRERARSRAHRYASGLPGRLAQLGERRLDKAEVTGSSPVSPTRKPRSMRAFVVQGRAVR